MYIMYVDESGVTEMTHPSQYFITTGTIFHENHLEKMKEEIQNYKDNNFTGSLQDVEIHVHDMWKGKGDFHGFNLNQKIALLNPLYDTINRLMCTTIAVIVDKNKFVQRHHPAEILDYGYMLLVERFDNFLRENNNKGVIRIDKSTQPNETKLNSKDSDILKLINKVRKHGTRFQRSARDIVEEPDFLHSFARKGLQVADCVAYCTSRKHNSTDFDAYWNLIYPKFRKSQSGKVLGYGLVYYPK